MTLVLKQVEVERYGRFRERTTLKLRPLTFLFGVNGAGKTALTEAITFTAQALSGWAHPWDGPLPFVAFWHPTLATTPEIDLAFVFDDLRLEATVQAAVFGDVSPFSSASPFTSVKRWGLTDGNRSVEITSDVVPSVDDGYRSEVPCSVVFDDGEPQTTTVKWDGLVPSFPLPGEEWLTRGLTSLQIWSETVRRHGTPYDLPFSVGVDIMEHPTKVLHPSAHGEIADSLIGACRLDRSIVVETHSEILLLRARRRIAEGRLSYRDLGVYVVSRDENGSRILEEVRVNDQGDVENWPAGLFYEAYEEVSATLKAVLERRAKGTPCGID